MTDNLNLIEIFCEEHGRISKVEHQTQIICRINGHHLAFGFPYDRIWEYCCDCEVFQSSRLAKGKVETECRICKRRTVRRYMCHNCQTISFESDQPPRGKHDTVIRKTTGDSLCCAGCLAGVGEEKMFFHQCANLGIGFLTTRIDCLFCRRKITELSDTKKGNSVCAAKNAKAGIEIISIECPNERCQNLIASDSVFCSFCGLRIKHCVAAECGLPVNPTAIFCPYCGTVIGKPEKPPSAAK